MTREIRKIDLHMHSVVSDGTDTPEELLAKVREQGFDLFALTDHDAVKGCKQILGARSAEDPAFLTGVEFSCKDEEGKYHILGYGFDPDAEAVQKIIMTGHSYRMSKVVARIEFVRREFGFELPRDEIDRLLALDNPGKPHLANLLVKYGYVENKDIAIRDYIDKIRFGEEYVRPETAIAGILESGGIPVLAHPAYGSGDEIILGDTMERRVRKLMGYGIQGLEAYYSGFTRKIRKEMLDLSAKFNLYVTAGSDYHGRNKIVILGDTGLHDTAEGAEGLHRFLEKVEEKLDAQS